MMGVDKLYYRAGAGPEVFQHLEDGGYIEREYHGESYRFRVVVFCSCGGNPQTPDTALRWEGSLARSAWVPDPAFGGLGFTNRASNGAAAKKSPDTTVSLARYFFPQVVQGAGIQMNPLQTNAFALAHHLNRWKLQGIEISTMRLMMEEFARHPEWCHRSKKSPWQVFVGRRGDLASLVATQQRKDPGARTGTIRGASYWDCHTPRAYSPA